MAEALELVLWVSADCQACDRARELMASLSAAMQFDWTEREGEDRHLTPVVTTSSGELLAEAPIVTSELVDAILAVNDSSHPTHSAD